MTTHNPTIVALDNHTPLGRRRVWKARCTCATKTFRMREDELSARGDVRAHLLAVGA